MTPRYLSENDLKQREEDILNHAVELIQNRCVNTLTIDKLVNEVSYSKGTVYNHFSSKEDVLVALSNRYMGKLVRLFVIARNIDSCPRNKMLTISFAYMLSILLNPKSFYLMLSISTDNFEKSSLKRTEEHKKFNDQLFNISHSIVQEAVDSNDLTLADGQTIEDISLSQYAMAFGTIALFLKKETPNSPDKYKQLERKILFHLNIAMDGVGWKQPKQEQDELLKKLKESAYAMEIKELNTRGIFL